MKWKCVLAVLLCVISVQAAYADLYWETVSESKGTPQGMPPNMPKEMMSQFNKTETVRNYLTEKAFRVETGDKITITDLDTMMSYHLNPKDKTVMKTDLKAMAQMGEMMKGMMDKIKITPTSETKKIAGYDCKKYQMSGMGEGEYWVSEQVKGYKQYQDMGLKMQKIMGNSPMLKNLMATVGKAEGFPVQTAVKMMGITTTVTLKQIEEKSLDKNLFKVPDGYKITEMGDMPMGAHPPMKKPAKQ